MKAGVVISGNLHIAENRKKKAMESWMHSHVNGSGVVVVVVVVVLVVGSCWFVSQTLNLGTL